MELSWDDLREIVRSSFDQTAAAEPLHGGLIIVTLSSVVLLLLLLPRQRRKLIRGPLVLMCLHILLLLMYVGISPDSPIYSPLSYGALFFLLAALGRTWFLLCTSSIVAHRLVRPLPKIFLDLVQAMIYLVVLLVVLKAAEVDTSSLVTGSALVTAAIGFSMKDTIGNMFAGLAIQVQRPFEIDDWIQFDQYSHHIGKVLEINWRATKVITLDKVEVIIPNSQLAEAPIRNFTKPQQHSRRSIYVVTPYDVPTGMVREIMLEAVSHAWGVLKDPPPSIVTNDFNERGVEHWVRIFTDEFDYRDKVDGSVRDRIWYALHRHGIEIPGPLRHVELFQAGPDAEVQKEEIKLRERLAALHYVDFLDDLPADALKQLATASQRRYYTGGEVIVKQGDDGSEFFIILSGEVKVMYEDERGRSKEIQRMKATGFFGEIACITGEKRSATVWALCDSDLIVVDREAFRSVLVTSPKLAEDMSQIIASRKAVVDGLIAGASDDDGDAFDARRNDLLNRIRNFFGL